TRHTDTIRIELETDKGTTTVEGAIVLDRPRLLAVDGIHCESALIGHLMFFSIQDVPGVMGYIGAVTGSNNINIATLTMGRQEKPSAAGEPVKAIIVIETEHPIAEPVMAQLLENQA